MVLNVAEIQDVTVASSFLTIAINTGKLRREICKNDVGLLAVRQLEIIPEIDDVSFSLSDLQLSVLYVRHGNCEAIQITQENFPNYRSK